METMPYPSLLEGTLAGLDRVSLILVEGNAGDDLIHIGIAQMLKRLNIMPRIVQYGVRDYGRVLPYILKKVGLSCKKIGSEIIGARTMLRYRKILDAMKETDAIVISTGFSLSYLWISGCWLLHFLSKYVSQHPIVTTPMSVSLKECKNVVSSSIERRSSPTYLFVRGKSSLQELKDIRARASFRVLLDHDASFAISRRWLHDIALKLKRGRRKCVIAVRTDREGGILDLIDIARNIGVHTSECLFTDPAMLPFPEFVSMIASAEIVVTDRLHTSILRTLLDLPTVLVDHGITHKVREVYEQSLRNTGLVRYVSR